MFAANRFKSGGLSPDRLPGLAAWYSADYGVLTQVGGGTAFASASSQRIYTASTSTLTCGGDQEFTFSGWVKFNALTAYQAILGKGPIWGTGNNNEYTLFLASGGGLTFGVRAYGDATANTTVDGGFGAPNASISAGVWVFFSAWHDPVADTLNLQVNGGTVLSQAWSGGIASGGTQQFAIGAHGGLGSFLNGTLDEVAFHKRVLTSNERTWLYNAGAGRTYSEADASLKTNLVSWWSMNAPATGDWQDQHGDNDLTPSASRPTATEGVTFRAAADTETVRRWLDRSGNGRNLDQAVLANQPTLSAAGLNGLPMVYFDGAAGTLAFPNVTIPSPWTAILVFRIDSMPARAVQHLGATAELFTDNSGNVRPDKMSMYSGAYQYSSTLLSALTTYRCVALVGDGATNSSAAYFNFTKATTGLGNTNVSGNFTTAGTIARIGASAGASLSSYSNESVSEVIIYGENKIANFPILQKYILRKYGI
jgi:hypothetical protein